MPRISPPLYIVILPYVAGLSEDIRRVCREFNIEVIFRAGWSLRAQLNEVKDKLHTSPHRVRRGLSRQPSRRASPEEALLIKPNTRGSKAQPGCWTGAMYWLQGLFWRQWNFLPEFMNHPLCTVHCHLVCRMLSCTYPSAVTIIVCYVSPCIKAGSQLCCHTSSHIATLK